MSTTGALENRGWNIVEPSRGDKKMIAVVKGRLEKQRYNFQFLIGRRGKAASTRHQNKYQNPYAASYNRFNEDKRAARQHRQS